MSKSDTWETGIEVPRLWVDRDPKNNRHVVAALMLLIEMGTLHVSEKTLREIFPILPRLSKKLKLWPQADELADCMVGDFYWLTEPMKFSDNVIITCNQCRTALQIRPHSVGVSKLFLCCFCAVDKTIAAYWSSRTAPSSTTP